MGQNRLTPNVVDPQIRDLWRAETQREWTEDAKVTAWRRWGPVNIAAQRNATIALLDAAQLTPGLRIIDIGGGGGDPGLAAAARVGPTGNVAVTDISPGMLETARQLGRQHGLTNITYHVADAEQLPFDDRSFDRALCRCAVMFFPDHDAALREIRRVLLPGGRAAFLAWGPLSDNPLFSGVFAAIGTVLSPPQPPPGAPSPFKFASPGSLGAALEHAGYRDVAEQTIQVVSRWNVTPEQFTDLVSDMGGLDWLLSQMSTTQRDDVIGLITDYFRGYQIADAIEFPLTNVLATGVRPLE